MALLVRHLDADGSLARYRGYDAHSESRESQGDVVLKVAYLGNAYSLGRSNLVEGDGRSYGGLYLTYVDAEALEHLDDFLVVCLHLFHVNIGLAVVGVLVEQVESRIAVSCEGFEWIDGGVDVVGLRAYVAVGLVFLAHLYCELAVGTCRVFFALGVVSRLCSRLCRLAFGLRVAHVGKVDNRGELYLVVFALVVGILLVAGCCLDVGIML